MTLQVNISAVAWGARHRSDHLLLNTPHLLTPLPLALAPPSLWLLYVLFGWNASLNFWQTIYVARPPLLKSAARLTAHSGMFIN